jgi:hypothetical protein
VHAEEVYACEFLEALDGRLCTASDTSLFLWDLAAAGLVQRCGPPDVLADKRSGAAPCKCCVRRCRRHFRHQAAYGASESSPAISTCAWLGSAPPMAECRNSF